MSKQLEFSFTRRTAIFGALSGLTLALSACGGSSSAASPTELRYQGAANEVTLPELAADLGFLGSLTLKWVGNTISGPQDIQSVATNQTDFGGAFAGAIVKLVEAGAAVTGVVNYYGEDQQTFNGYFVKDDAPIHNARDLIGKKVAVNALGAHLEAVLTTFLLKNSLTEAEAKEVQLVPLAPNDTESAIRRGQVDVGALGGPLQYRAIDAGGLRSLFSDVELFGTFAGGQIVFRNDFLAKNPDTVKTFATGVAKAIQWLGQQPKAEVIAKFTEIIEKRGRSESTAALKYWRSIAVPDNGAVHNQDFSRWADWLKLVGAVNGPLDPTKYYSNKFNELASASS